MSTICSPEMLSLTHPLLRLHSPKLTTTHFSPFRHHLRRHSLSSTQIRMSSSTSIVEHIVLFTVKDTASDAQRSAMLNGLNGLKSLDMVQHITAGPLYRNRSSSLKFTHMLHSRYSSKEDLAAYSAHLAHVDVVKSNVQPICEDVMAIDWVAQIHQPGSALKPGSALRVQFVKLKEALGEREKGEVLDVISSLKGKVDGMEEFTFGENFSPARAKGYSIASIGVFKGLKELDEVAQNEEIAKDKDKVRDSIDSLVVVDYVIPSGQSASL